MHKSLNAPTPCPYCGIDTTPAAAALPPVAPQEDALPLVTKATEYGCPHCQMPLAVVADLNGNNIFITHAAYAKQVERWAELNREWQARHRNYDLSGDGTP